MKMFNHEKGRLFDSDGAKIYYEIIGNKEKPVLVMLHGGFENIENLNGIASYISNDFCILGIDTRGHGKSTLGEKKLTYRQIQSDVENLLISLNLHTVSMIGFSDGGIVAFRIAAEKRVEVEKLVAIGASWRNEDIDEGEEILSGITSESAREIFKDEFTVYEKVNAEPNADYLTKAIVEMWTDRTDEGYPNDNVKKITAETLLIRGDNDFLISLESLNILKSNIKDSKLMNIPFAEHVVYKEQAECVEIVIKQFLNI